jgi:uncharacterized protein (TIGR03435 family)
LESAVTIKETNFRGKTRHRAGEEFRADRPVVDQTGLDGHYDFQLNWTPDETQFSGIGITVPPPSDKPDAPPVLGIAMLDQLGLKLTTTKAPVEVIVIDHIEKPSAN